MDLPSEIDSSSLDAAVAEARRRYQSGTGTEFPAEFDFRLVCKSQFAARVYLADDKPVVEVSDGALLGIDQLWRQALASTTLIDDGGERMTWVPQSSPH